MVVGSDGEDWKRQKSGNVIRFFNNKNQKKDRQTTRHKRWVTIISSRDSNWQSSMSNREQYGDLGKELTTQDQQEFCRLYKIGTVGDNNEPAPWSINVK